jgi:catechol 2,3-dioxygenase-like lactoylglutathione lyase family enzyme
MLDHLSPTPSDLDRSLAFYEKALAPLGIRRLMARTDEEGRVVHAGYGDDQFPYFWLGDGEPTAGKVHVAFRAPSRAAVDAFHAAAVAGGGRDNGTPGVRRQYHPGYYGAFVFDPDGVNVEAVHHTFGNHIA